MGDSTDCDLSRLRPALGTLQHARHRALDARHSFARRLPSPVLSYLAPKSFVMPARCFKARRLWGQAAVASLCETAACAPALRTKRLKMDRRVHAGERAVRVEGPDASVLEGAERGPQAREVAVRQVTIESPIRLQAPARARGQPARAAS